MEACSLLVNLWKGMQSSSEQPLVGEERYVTTLITAAKETGWLTEGDFNHLMHAIRYAFNFGKRYATTLRLAFILGSSFGQD